MRRQKCEVGTQQQEAVELQQPMEMQQVPPQTQVSRDARAHAQGRGAVADPCILVL